MSVAMLLIAIATAVLACMILAERLDVPAPFVLIVVGVAGSYALPPIHLSAHVVLLGLLPPLLYAAAFQTSLVDFAANKRPILFLSVGLVAFTAAGVAVVTHALVAGLSWPLAFAIGAVVAPPDAIAATAVGRRIGLPRRITTILEGESLLNDATALVLVRTALGVAAGEAVSAWRVGLDFVLAAGGGAVVGFLAFVIVSRIRRLVRDYVTDAAVSLIIPFAAYLGAEQIHASGVIAVVVVGLLLGHLAPRLQTAQARIADRLNWRTIAHVLENVVFLLIGLQARTILDEAHSSKMSDSAIAIVCLATLATVIILRLIWVVVVRYAISRPGIDPSTGRKPPWTSTFVLAWAGMRGVVTLAAAFLLPPIEDGDPLRAVLVTIAFAVVAGTLLLQGATLPWVARRLKVPAPDPAADALARARLLQRAADAGEAALDAEEFDDRYGVRAELLDGLEARTRAAWARLGAPQETESPPETMSRLRRSMIHAERRQVLDVRRSGRVPAPVVADVLAMLDVEEAALDTSDRARARMVQGATRASCVDLERVAPLPDASADACDECGPLGHTWVALRRCLTCGHVGCSDSSVGAHAAAHFRATGHVVAQSAEAGEHWRWCYLHRMSD
ncbi:Na+/H+ antiporter [Nocardioides baekrokdamisoli]|uniref:Na+/H+ antiporter n=1 Tax=Nocardioides baekrokdamisoli TaxID=1804624 RepID=A0A3G9J078_9ACTN|nr:cation:proton antiporter [Nocardioides baekrokdamisoli]BBH16379.1 Na+/H+ antiporter [Nocardioides baekrokdamisoli]